VNVVLTVVIARIVQGLSTLTAGIVLGIAIAWKIGLVGMGKCMHGYYAYILLTSLSKACIPFLLSAGLTGLV
jgi:hypothetical protein